MPKANNLITISKLDHTWLIDLDGTILKHNGHLNGQDELLPGVKDFFENIPTEDYIILLTARSEEYKNITIQFLNKMGIRYDKAIFNLPKGERILINDRKPAGLKTAIAVNLERNLGILTLKIDVDKNL
ncbi:hypothetical protein [Polynucleobacter sp. AP-Kaivos-20-H2]|uniref:hypothetical protein n=1 Tax=Polynucleobacter sp. AP-Kaivos-20-H2 TaxID=2689104 RepID=UPI001C0D2CB3|nr:hypothetical protein [Polynucleobacter sp. AP-Kaivos-20-H2]